MGGPRSQLPLPAPWHRRSLASPPPLTVPWLPLWRPSWRKGPVNQARPGARLLASRSWAGITSTCAGGTLGTVTAESCMWVSSLPSTALTCGVHSVPTLQIRKLRPRLVEYISQGHWVGRNVAPSRERWQGFLDDDSCLIQGWAGGGGGHSQAEPRWPAKWGGVRSVWVERAE